MSAVTYRVADFDYEFPADLIAQRPLPDRAASRLLHVDRGSDSLRHAEFAMLPDLMRPGDLLVVNTSRVIRARLHGVRQNGRMAEILLVSDRGDGTWLAMVHPGGKLKAGRTVRFGDDSIVEIVEVIGGGLRRVSLTGSLTWEDLMHRFGEVPLPPYIERDAEPDDRERYQTVFAHSKGSVAAPTAGLHFTEDLLGAVRAKGCSVVDVVLHVGPGTFKPIQVDDLRQHTMQQEWYDITEEAADLINQTKAGGRRIFAVGTTVTRVLETAGAGGAVIAGNGWTDLFVYPPHTFCVVDALVTNFHLPRSTLLMLVSAFGGIDLMRRAYREAIEHRYRLFSYGDAMVIT